MNKLVAFLWCLLRNNCILWARSSVKNCYQRLFTSWGVGFFLWSGQIHQKGLPIAWDQFVLLGPACPAKEYSKLFLCFGMYHAVFSFWPFSQLKNKVEGENDLEVILFSSFLSRMAYLSLSPISVLLFRVFLTFLSATPPAVSQLFGSRSYFNCGVYFGCDLCNMG